MPTTFCVCTRDNRWISQKLSMEKNTIGNEPYIKKATVLGSFFVLILLYELMKIKNRRVWEENENLRISANAFNAQSDPGVVFKFFSASQQSMRSI